MEVVKVGTEAIPAIQLLAEITWAFAYKDILSAAQMSYMLHLIYSKESLQQQMLEKKHQFVLLTAADKPSGFASYSIKAEHDNFTYRLHKIYVNPALQGIGAGKYLLDYVLQDIKSLGAESLELNVNRHNKAIGFYRKHGFEVISTEDIPIGNGYFMNDFVMRLSW